MKGDIDEVLVPDKERDMHRRRKNNGGNIKELTMLVALRHIKYPEYVIDTGDQYQYHVRNNGRRQIQKTREAPESKKVAAGQHREDGDLEETKFIEKLAGPLGIQRKEEQE